MRILAVETSADEAAAAVVRVESGESLATIESSVVSSQMELHEKYGGIYPEVASREHVRQILPVIAEALGLPLGQKDRLPNFGLSGIDVMAVTHGPGLVGSLLVGTQTVATLAFATCTPLVGVNHLAGHIYANWLRHDASLRAPEFPLLAMIVSGGHTMILYMRAHNKFELIGQTRDDAVGEAFDKVAKMLGLGYPGGPQISRLAEKGDRHAYPFPIGLAGEGTLDFSYSGLKTAVLRVVQSQSTAAEINKANIAASFEHVAIEALLSRVVKALEKYPVKDFVLGGGVAANAYLRARLASLIAHRPHPVHLHVPPLSLCTDNAAVIGAAAAFGASVPLSGLECEAFPRLSLVK